MLSLHILVERLDSGHFIASVSELADCVAEAENREDAISLMGMTLYIVLNKDSTKFLHICYEEIELKKSYHLQSC